MEKNILPNLTNSQEPEPVIFAPWSGTGAARKKIPGAGADWEMGKKSGAGAAKKLAGSPALIILQSFFHLSESDFTATRQILRLVDHTD